MSFLDDLDRLANPLKKLVLTGPAHAWLSDKSTVVTFMCHQTGNKLSIAADYIREGDVVYLMVDMRENCWKNLETGSTVQLRLEGSQYSGWAEGLTGYEEFFRILSQNSAKQEELIERYEEVDATDDLYNLEKLQSFLTDYKLIRVKISRQS